MTRAKPKARKTRPSLRVGKKSIAPEDDDARKRRSEAPTLPPPKPGDEPLKHSARVRKGRVAVTVDVVTADLSKDRRREE